MKRFVLIACMMTTIVVFAQKKKNGTIFIDHPVIQLVEDMQKAFVAGDTTKVASFLADDFTYMRGNDSRYRDGTPGTKSDFLSEAAFWHNNIENLQIERFPNSYPDALEYKESGMWVQTWEMMRGMHKNTGVKMDMPIHRLFKFNEDNKIAVLINYYDQRIFQEIGQSLSDRKNGIIYNHHDNINTVRKVIAAMGQGDLEKVKSFFTENAQFNDINQPADAKAMTMAESEESFQWLLDNFTINTIDVQGYPDYLEYDDADAKVVQSWWTFRLTRKSNDQPLNLSVFFIHDFDDEGKITREIVYYSGKLLEAE